MYKINRISLLFSFLFVIAFVYLYSKIDSSLFNKLEEADKITFNYFYNLSDNVERNYKYIIKENTKYKSIDREWRLEINSINLKAKISEGTDEKTLNKYIGHFENTKKEKGNIGLAAHNRGYKVNYFQNIKNLNAGDEIYYFYNGKQYIYIVYEKRIILDTDWSVLENKKNELTLITCVENRDEYRRCIKAKKVNNENGI